MLPKTVIPSLRYRHFLAGCALAFCSGLQAEVQEVSGEFFYGPNTSEKQACEAAEQRAKQEALRLVLGESISSSEQLSCKDGAAGVDDTQCVYNTFRWTEIEGDIKQATRLGQQVDKLMGSSRCTVTMRIEVDVPKLQPDPSFDFQVKLNANRLRGKEAVSFQITPSAAMHMAVFAWAPSHNAATVSRIFPNAFDSQSRLAARVNHSIPSEAGGSRYQFEVDLPKGGQQDFVDEYLIFVATTTPVAWLDEYDFDKFKSRLREISPPQKRLVKQSYRIIR
jgi:hypothetical protein